MKNQLILGLIALLLISASACERVEDDFTVSGDKTFFVPNIETDIVYQVDSTIFDPSINGTDRIRSTHFWSLVPFDTTESKSTFLVQVRDTLRSNTFELRYLWDFTSIPTSNRLEHLSEIGGLTYTGLITPFTEATTWNALGDNDPDQEILVAGETIQIHKGWTNARIDSIGPYVLPNGEVIEAVWVELTNAENLIELRQFTEVYAKGYGLLERTQRFLDTQQIDPSIAWEDKAEKGFIVSMKRVN